MTQLEWRSKLRWVNSSADEWVFWSVNSSEKQLVPRSELTSVLQSVTQLVRVLVLRLDLPLETQLAMRSVIQWVALLVSLWVMLLVMMSWEIPSVTQ